MKSISRPQLLYKTLFLVPLVVFLLSALATIAKISEYRRDRVQAEIQNLEDQKPIPITATAFSADSKLLLVGSLTGAVRCYDANTGSLLRELHSAEGQVQDVSFSPEGRTAAAIIGNTLLVWEWPSGRLKRTLKGKLASLRLAYSPDGSTLAVGVKAEGIRLWNMDSGTYTTLNAHFVSAVSLAFSHDGKSLATCCNVYRDGLGHHGAANVVQCWDIATRQRRWEKGDEDVKGMVEFSPDDKKLAVACNNPTWVDAQTGKRGLEMKGDNDMYAGNFDISPDGSVMVATNSGYPFFFCDTTNGHAGHFTNNRDSGAMGHAVLVFGFSPDQKHFVQGDFDGLVKMWDVEGLNWKDLVAARQSRQPPLLWTLNTLSEQVR